MIILDIAHPCIGASPGCSETWSPSSKCRLRHLVRRPHEGKSKERQLGRPRSPRIELQLPARQQAQRQGRGASSR